MTKNSVEQKYSEAAILAALHRTIVNKELKNEKYGLLMGKITGDFHLIMASPSVEKLVS